jgi:hypothetical protein
VPPGVGDPETIGRRTVLHLLMIAISLLAAIAAVRLRRSLTRTLAPALATGLGAGAYLVLVLAAGLALPAADALPASFPADTLWDFRQASVATQATLWATTGVVFALAAQRVMTGRPVWSLRGARSAARGGG